MALRSYLYVPSDNLGRLVKAPTYGSDAIIADLEDGVSIQNKDLARSNLRQWLQDLDTEAVIWVRINPESVEQDLESAVNHKVSTIVLPKSANSTQIEELSSKLRSLELTRGITKQLSICALIESAEGVLNALQIARSYRVCRLILGELDLRANLGLPLASGEEVLQFARNTVIFSSSAGGIGAPIASMSPNFTDLQEFEKNSRLYSAWGYVGRTCIHPNQIEIVHKVFCPSANDVEAAEDILRRLKMADGGVAVDSQGKMIDEAVARNARRIRKLS
jgi:citrate lyase subunit beta/citryl-CoA lyase